MDIGVQSTSFQVEDRSWLLSPHGTEPGTDPSVVLDITKFSSTTHYANGFIKSGCVLGKITATGLYGPYGGTTEEVQTVTEGGSGLTSFTLTYSGQTTGSIAAAATAATVQAALLALSNIGAAGGTVTVTGANGGPYSVTFGGTLADTDVAQMTATPTGGTGTVTVTTATAGGADATSDGTQVAVGILFAAVRVTRQDGTVPAKIGAAMLVHGFVDPAKLPYSGAAGGIDAAAQTDLKFIHFSTGA